MSSLTSEVRALNPEPERAAAPKAASKRYVFVDLARSITVLMMLQGHSLHVLLAPHYQQSALFKAWHFVRGLTAPMFMSLSGFSFSVATHKRWSEHVRIGAPMARRIRRFAFFLFLGYAIHLPTNLVSKVLSADPQLLNHLLNVDVLQLIATSLVTLQLLVLLAKTPLRFAWAGGLLALAITIATPLVRVIEWKTRLWPPLAAYLYSGTGSLFPLFGWSSFVFAGAALGSAFMQRQPISHDRLSGAFALIGVCALGIGRILRALAGKLYFDAITPEAKPRFLMARFGGAMIGLAGFVQASRRIERLTPPLQALAEESLIVYLVHLCLLYGSIWGPGLRQLIGNRLGLPATLGVIVGLMAVMTLMAYLWNRVKKGDPVRRRIIRLAIALALAYPIL